MTAKERAERVWDRIVRSGETGMAVEWIAEEIEQAIKEAIEEKEK